MIICKRPVPPDDHLQEAGHSGYSSCKRPAPPDDQPDGQQQPGVTGQKEEKKAKEKEKKEEKKGGGIFYFK